jgi:hypothetical protein
MVRHNAAMGMVRIALATVLVLSAACGDARPANAPQRVTGLITEVRRDEGRIASFTVETTEDRRYDISIDQNRDYGFDLEHLEEHREQRLPVLVRIDERDGMLYAAEILDA